MKKHLYYIFILIIVVCYNTGALAQITVGADVKPADFSLVQLEIIEKKGGFRLPRLSQTKCNELEAYLNSKTPTEKAAANGLVVYNIDTGLIQYWTGDRWSDLDAVYKITGENGLTQIDNTNGGLKLGGALKDDTTVDLNGDNTPANSHILSFPTTGANDVFKVSDNAGTSNTFFLKNGQVGIGTSSPQAVLDIDNTGASLFNGLRISNSGEKQGYLLASDYYGNAYWQPLRPLSSIREVYLNTSTNYGHNGATGSNPTNEFVVLNKDGEALRLNRGKWLIVSKYTGMTESLYSAVPVTGNTSTDQRTFYSYIHLRKTSRAISSDALTSGRYTSLSVGGGLPSAQRSSYGGVEGHYVTPQLVYFAEVTAAEEYFWIVASSSRKNKTSSAYGSSYLYALRVDEILGSGVAIQGSVENINVSVTTRNMYTGQTLSSTALGNVRIKLTTGSLHLEPGNVIGHVNGIILAVGGTNNIDISPTDIGGVSVPVVAYGTLESYVLSGVFDVPFDIPNMTASPNFVPVRINVQSQADFDFTNLQSININTGKGKAISSTNSTIGFHLTSGSLTLTPGQQLGASNGITVRYNGGLQTYFSIGNYYIPVTISGTVNTSASGSFIIPITIQGGASENYGTFPTGGPTINVIDASLDCSVANVKSPVYTPVLVSGESISLTMNTGSASYTLLNGQLLGSASGITVKYTGSDLTMTANNTYQLAISVSSGSTILNEGIYSVPLNTLNNSVNIGVTACNLNVEVEKYGTFDCSGIPSPVFEYPAGATVPTPIDFTGTLKITVDNGSVTIENGEVLGQSGQYLVKVETVSPIIVTGTPSSPMTVDIPVRITGPGEITGDNFINMDVKKVGVKACQISFRIKQEEP